MKVRFQILLVALTLGLLFPVNFLYAAKAVKQGTKTATNKKVTLSAKNIKAEKDRSKKVAESEKLFKNLANYGVERYIVGIISDSLLNHDSTDIVNTAHSFNILSALINLSKKSKDPKLRQSAVKAEPIIIKYQRYYFSLLRKEYINDANKDRDLDDKFEYPNRCSNSDCEFFIMDSYCDAKKTKDVQFLEDVLLYGWDAVELRARGILFNYQSFLDECSNFSKRYKNSSPSDDNLMPIAYLGL